MKNRSFNALLATIGIYFFLIAIESNAISLTGDYDKPTGKKLVVSGIVKSTNGDPVAFANVAILGTVKGTYTHVDGSFEIYDLNDGDYQARVSAVGFKTLTLPLTIGSAKATNLEIRFEHEGVEMPEISVIAEKDRIFSKVPGSVNYFDEKELKEIRPISGNEVLRRSPGVHVVDEEGLGMRVNVGIRGLDPDRSRSVLVLEDGIPVALSPYGEPEMYYTPAIDRMAGIEILKGSGQILYGPQTIGGVINYITANPSEQESGNIRIQGGQGGFFSGLLNYGNTFGNTGVQVNLLKKSGNNIGPTEFDITDFNAKFLFDISAKSVLGVKLGVYDEVSNSTYIGITQTMYDAGGQDFTRVAPDDQLDVRRYALSMSHEYRFNPKMKLRTIAYGYTTTRNWNRQDFSLNTNNNTPPANWTGVVWGDLDVPGGAVFMRNSTGNRNRQFEVGGIEPRLEIDYAIADLKSELIVGTRYLYERAFEQRVNGTRAGVKSGNLMEDEVRTGYAASAYFQNQIHINSKLMLSGGLRYEHFDYERDIRRRTFNIGGQNVLRDTSLVSDNAIGQLIPGAGFTYRPTKLVSVFGGAHRGFAPPRIKDAISNIGEVYELGAELSWNYELGFRSEMIRGIFMELTAFHMDFSNQIIPVSESSGGVGVGLVNGGATIHRGIEGALVVDIAQLAGFKKLAVEYDINMAYVDARFSEDRFKGEVNISSNRTPYAPEIFLSSALTVRSQSGFGGRVTGTYVGSQFTDELNTISPSANGRIGVIPSYFVIDANAFYLIEKWNTEFNISVKNLTDERYIVTRRPQGIRVGLPQLFTAGINFRF
ncbi:MAG: TonB-dependent receptor [Cyclobacteriaceae bacterium]|nr:TonB-dependent receptor [Cyclobacteriaceae bacterium]